MFEEIQNYDGESYSFDIDSSPRVFELYKKIYSKNIQKKYRIASPTFFKYDKERARYINMPEADYQNRLYALPVTVSSKKTILINNSPYELYDAVERLSGDCFFNFNSNKIYKFKKYDGIDEKKLEECSKMHYSIYNMVLLQTVGNMQKSKQQGLKLSNVEYEKLDRGDTFVYLLNEFYENGNDEILQSSSKNNKESLKEYLNSFSLEEYCCEMLQIDDYDFIKKLINNGGKKIDSINVNNYLDIAIEFWEKRKATIDTYINK